MFMCSACDFIHVQMFSANLFIYTEVGSNDNVIIGITVHISFLPFDNTEVCFTV